MSISQETKKPREIRSQDGAKFSVKLDRDNTNYSSTRQVQYKYYALDDELLGFVERSDNADGSKSVIPYFIKEESGFEAGIPEIYSKCRPLFGLQSLQEVGKPLIIVEGEKCAAAVINLGFQCVTNLGGSGAANKADWSQISGYDYIYIWPDNDSAGIKWARNVSASLRAIYPSVQVMMIEVKSNKKGHDVIDWTQERFVKSWDGYDFEHTEFVRNKSQIFNGINSLIDDASPPPSDWNYKSINNIVVAKLGDFMKSKPPVIDSILAPWITTSSISMIYATRGLGKTFFAISCGLAIASGRNFLHYRCSKPRKVLYIDGEMQSGLMQQRFKNLQHLYPCAAENFYLINPDFQEDNCSPDLSLDKQQRRVDDVIDKIKPDVIFIDNKSTLLRSIKENDADDYNVFQNWLIRLRSTGLAVIIIHHANKNGAQRGTSKMEDILDNVLLLERPDDFSQGDETRFNISFKKNRSIPENEIQVKEATVIKHEDGKLEWSHKDAETLNSRIIELHKDGMQQKEIAQVLEINKSTVSKAISRFKHTKDNASMH